MEAELIPIKKEEIILAINHYGWDKAISYIPSGNIEDRKLGQLWLEARECLRKIKDYLANSSQKLQ